MRAFHNAYENKRDQEVVKMGERALSLATTIYGEEHSLVGQIHYKMGVASAVLGHFESAKEHANKALVNFEKNGQQRNLNFLATLHLLAEVCLDLGLLDETDRWALKALEFCQHEDMQHFSVRGASFLKLLVEIYVRRGTLDLAEQLAKKGLEIARSTAHAGKICSALNTLGGVHLSLGRYADARALFEECLHLGEGTQEFLETDRLIAKDNLGVTFSYLGDRRKSIAIHEEVLAAKRAIHGKDHPALVGTLTNLAQDYHDEGESGKSMTYLEEALQIQRKRFPRGHPHLARTLTSLGELRWMNGDFDGAEEAFAEAVDILERSLGESNPEIAFPMLQFARCRLAQGKLEAAETLCRQALALRKPLGSSHLLLADAYFLLALVLFQEGELRESQSACQKAAEIREYNTGSDDAFARQYRGLLQRILQAQTLES